MDTKPAIAALAALAQESRLATFRLLVQSGPEGLPATRIADTLGVPPSSLSFHLKELTHAGLKHLGQPKAIDALPHALIEGHELTARPECLLELFSLAFGLPNGHELAKDHGP